MVWLVQNCRSNKSMYFLRPPELRGGLSPWAPYQGSILEPRGDLKRSPDPSPTHAPPLIPNPGSAPDTNSFFLDQKYLLTPKLTWHNNQLVDGGQY